MLFFSSLPSSGKGVANFFSSLLPLVWQKEREKEWVRAFEFGCMCVYGWEREKEREKWELQSLQVCCFFYVSFSHSNTFTHTRTYTHMCAHTRAYAHTLFLTTSRTKCRLNWRTDPLRPRDTSAAKALGWAHQLICLNRFLVFSKGIAALRRKSHFNDH